MSHARISVQITTSLLEYNGDAGVSVSHYLRLVLIAVLCCTYSFIIFIVGYVFVIVNHLNIGSHDHTASFGLGNLTLTAHDNLIE